MRTLATWVLAAGVVTAGVTMAQPPQGKGGGRGMMGRQQAGIMLLDNKSVQEELKVTDDQKEKLKAVVDEAGKKVRELFTGGANFRDPEFQKKMAEDTKKIGDEALKEIKEKKILKDEQVTRFKQISWQAMGVAGTVSDDEVQKVVKLTGDQKDKIKTLTDDYRKDSAELLRDQSPEARTKRTALTKEYKEKSTEVLTADQKKAWKELVGKEFEVKFDAPAGGDRPRGKGKGKPDPA